ncbi:MAG: protein kinase, partial [Candidatus Riflebacteria bacterium]|nr:protein kinase [Candidatus Riflebacteria bacterium]
MAAADGPGPLCPAGEMPPELLCRYRPLGRLGSGAMGVVLQARSHETGELVAIKLLRDTDNCELVSRFRREGRLSFKVDHPHVVRVL